MLKKISDRLYSWTKGWLILLSIFIFLILANLKIFDPNLVSQSLDGQIFYSAQTAFNTIDAYGIKEREQMQWIHVLDFFLILIYTSMFTMILSWLLERCFDPTSKYRLLNLVPLLGGLFDVTENIWIMILIQVWPAQPKLIAWLAAIFTIGKYLMGVPIILLILIGLVLATKNHFKIMK